MKICQLCAVDFTLYHFLLPLMDGMRDAGHDVFAVCSDGPLIPKIEGRGYRVVRVPIARSYGLASHLRAMRELTRLFRRERVDIVHVHTPVAALVGRVAARLAGVRRIVYTAHGFYFHERMPLLQRALHIVLEWLAGRLTDVLFTQSSEDADTARALGLCRTRAIHSIGNGVDPRRFRPVDDDERAATRTRIGAGPGTVVIAVIGRLVAEKGYPELFDAMRRVDAELWVIGERLASDHASGIATAITAAERDPVLSARIRFLGYRDDIPRLLAAADIFTLPSHREGMPRSIIEAMMTGLPVVATDIRGSREEVVEGETGFLIPVGDGAALAGALRRLASDAVLRKRLGAAGHARAIDLYDESKVVRRQLDVLGLGRA
jgi:glycosyltransferase involved in cell wall biosynthesis